jgi:hypothetical protein
MSGAGPGRTRQERRMNGGKKADNNGDGPEVVETRTARLWLGEDGILRSVVKPGTDHDVEDAEANMEAGFRLAAGREVPVLIDMTEMSNVTPEARRRYASPIESRQYASAMALVVHSHISWIIGNFVIGLSRPRMPMRLFRAEADAVRWLQGFL